MAKQHSLQRRIPKTGTEANVAAKFALTPKKVARSSTELVVTECSSLGSRV